MSKYKDKKIIGSGAFGEVWKCKRNTDGSVFAKKILKTPCDEEAKIRFQKEVRILAKLDHPNIVSIIARRLGEEPIWYVMPLYSHSLFNELAGLVGDEERIHKVFGAILDALDYAHSEGVIHRDLKPENVLMNNDDDVVITDFGLGRIIDSHTTRLTGTGYTMGTDLYMAPEQFSFAKNADKRSDIFTLGRMLYELFTGRLTSAIQDTTKLDPAIAVIVDRCTRPEPEDRFQSVAALKKAWHAAIGAKDSLSDYEHVKEISARLTATRRPEEGDIDDIIELLSRYIDDSDLLHDIIMELPTKVVRLMVREDTKKTRALITQFVKHTGGQGWGFSYTDSIGNHCKSLYDEIDDPIIRADLLYCVVQVGENHSRWKVMGIATDLFHRKRDEAESIAITNRFDDASGIIKRWVCSNLKPARLDENLRDMIEDWSESIEGA